MIKILIVEDQIEHQQYLKTIVLSNAQFKYLGIIRNGLEAIKEIQLQKPDVVIMDIGLPDISGIDCIRQLKPLCPDTKFMVCTVNEEDELIFDALKAGAHSYIVKKSKPYQIIDAITEVHAGEMPISSCIATKILNYMPQSKGQEGSGIARNEEANTDETTEKITPKEAELLKLLAQGCSYKEICELHEIKITTIKWHIYNIYKKLQARNRTEAINKYFKKS